MAAHGRSRRVPGEHAPGRHRRGGAGPVQEAADPGAVLDAAGRARGDDSCGRSQHRGRGAAADYDRRPADRVRRRPGHGRRAGPALQGSGRRGRDRSLAAPARLPRRGAAHALARAVRQESPAAHPRDLTETSLASPFTEGFVEADGFRIRYLQAGQGVPLVHFHGAGGLRLTPAHELLSSRFRVVAFEMPGFGDSPENKRTQTMPELASTMGWAISKLGIDTFNLMGTSFGGKTALWLALQSPQNVHALVLEAPAAIRQPGAASPAGTPEEIARLLYAHPERLGSIPPPDPAVRAKTQPLVQRLRGPDRDADLEARLPELPTPTLVLFGTRDRVIAPAMGRVYKDLLPSCHLVFVYDAGHGIGTDRPEAFTDVVTDFLERREAFVISRAETVIHP
ncbi:MAG: hypothetical protein DMD97_23705 [Candidatus Rokuibacteriota bacterium]|nr:MAG: hypothetical protein DMD97_23705 [Candidatus Rokubacteria bacterium]